MVVSVFFADTVNASARQTSTITSIILASPCGDRETMEVSSAYSITHTARRTWSKAGSGPIAKSPGNHFKENLIGV